jgi:hypothetical protein
VSVFECRATCRQARLVLGAGVPNAAWPVVEVGWHPLSHRRLAAYHRCALIQWLTTHTHCPHLFVVLCRCCPPPRFFLSPTYLALSPSPGLVACTPHRVCTVGCILALKYYKRQDVRIMPIRENEEALIAPSHRQASHWQLTGDTSTGTATGQVAGPLSGKICLLSCLSSRCSLLTELLFAFLHGSTYRMLASVF